MEQPHAHEGAEAHSHDHPHIVPQGPPPLPLDPSRVVHVGEMPQGQPPVMPQTVQPMQVRDGVTEAVNHGAQEWFAREFVGGLLALADARGVDRVTFLSERLMMCSTRLATAESEIVIMRTQLQVAQMEVDELRARLADCPCHDSVGEPGIGQPESSDPSITNGDHP